MEELNQIKENSKLLVDICLGLKKECQYGDIRDKKNENKLSRMSRLMTEIIGKSINYNLENNWVEDMYSIPDKNLMMRSNEEAKAVLESLINYYEKLQTDCMTLKEELKSAIETGKQDLERVLDE